MKKEILYKVVESYIEKNSLYEKSYNDLLKLIDFPIEEEVIYEGEKVYIYIRAIYESDKSIRVVVSASDGSFIREIAPVSIGFSKEI